MASKPVSEQYRKAFQDFTGGLMTRPNPLQIPANKFNVLQNAIINDHDILEKVQGYTLDGSPFPNTTDSFIRMLTTYRVGDNLATLVCAAADDGNANTTYKVDLKQSNGDGVYNYIGHTIGTALFTHNSATVTGLGTTWTKHLKTGDKIGTGAQPSQWYEILAVGSDTSITLTSNYLSTTTTQLPYMARIILNVNNIPVSVVFNNNLIISNGSEVPMETNNVSLGKLQSAYWEPVELLELHKNRVFGANWSSSPSGILWTYVNDETTVDATSYATVFANDNGQIVQIKSFANSLMVFKDNGNVYQIIGEFDQSAQGQPAMIRKIDCPDNVGVISGRTVCILEDNSGQQGYMRLGSKIYFLSETGIYSINSYMQVQKVSWDIQPTVSNLLLKSTAVATKQYNFTSKAQWDTGTINSLSDSRVLNGMSTFFDTNIITGALVTNGGSSTAIASNSDVHTVYISSDGQTVRHNQWIALDNTTIDTKVIALSDSFYTALTTGFVAYSAVAIGVAPNGNIGIVSKTNDADHINSNGGPGTFYYVFSEFSSGAWTNTLLNSGQLTPASDEISYSQYATGAKVVYDGASNPHVLMAQGQGSSYHGFGLCLVSRSSGVWTTAAAGTFANQDYSYTDCKFVFDVSNNIHVVATTLNNTQNIEYWKSTNGGATFTQPSIGTSTNGIYTVPGTSIAEGFGTVNIFINSLSQPVIVYNFVSGTGGDLNKVIRYNLVTFVKSASVPGSNNALLGSTSLDGNNEVYYSRNLTSSYESIVFNTSYKSGTAIFTSGSKAVTGTGTKWTTWVKSGDLIRLASDSEVDYVAVDTVNSDNSITLLSNYSGTTIVSPAAYITRRTNTVSNTTALGGGYSTQCDLTNNGNVVSLIAFGSSANTVQIRRITLFGQWTSPIDTDSTLSVWSTYVVGSPVTNGNDIVYEVGINTSSTMPDNLIYQIVPGTVISTNESETYILARISFTLSIFAPASVSSLVLSYIGLGVDAKLPFGYVYNNEMYLSVTSPSGIGNNEILFLDRIGAWGTFTHGSCAMTRYNQQLYVGDSVSGNIYKFRQGYDFNGADYSLIAITKEDLLGSIELQKEIYKVYVVYQTQAVGDFTFSYRFDNFLNPSSSQITGWVDAVIDQTKGTVFEIVGMSGQKCSSIQFKIQQDDADVQVGIVGFIVLYDYYNLR